MRITGRLLRTTRLILQSLLTFTVNLSIIASRGFIRAFNLFRSFGSFFRGSKRVIGESFVALFICALGDLVAGIFLGKMSPLLESYPGLLVLIPGAIGMRGNIFGALGSRLGSGLHIGTLSPELRKSDVLTENIEATIILTVVMSIFLGFMAWVFCHIFGFRSMGIMDFIVISVAGGIISGAVLLPATVLISLKSYENGWDPDNVTTPLIAASGDLFTLPSIFAALAILEAVKNGIFEWVLFFLFILMGALGLAMGIKGQYNLRRIIRQSVPVLLLCSALGTTAGIVLNSKLSFILDNPAILALVPLFSGESGDLVSILGARLSSGLHSGIVPATLRPHGEALRNFGIISVLSLIIYPTIGLLAHVVSVSLGIGSLGLERMVLISSLAGYLLTPFLLLVGFYLSSASYRLELDPDNIVIPLSTSMTDPVANTCLVIAIIAVIGI
ncbi:magnesium transporter [Methanothermobacter sp. K4]|uniref:magnesium transporter n=1 Tax=Methanothermobacter sp. K4 TaxID=2913262 RepID=UPI001EDC16AC|nr:magnesium transporter [Methanothermobacter sp. K4]MCG2827958.1 magnesium transporter [Methanothermobacter sp. K4]